MVKRALLLPNIGGFPSESMRRYASELGAALRELRGTDWDLAELSCDPEPSVARFFGGGPFGDRMASRHARFWKYPSLIRRSGPRDVFHIVDHSHANLVSACPRRRAVITCHDIIPLLASRGIIDMPHPRATRFTFPLRVRAMRRCARIIAISESTRSNLIEVAGVPAEQIRVVYYGVNAHFAPASDPATAEAERAELRNRHGLPPQARVILHVATATRYKNTPALVQALHLLRKEGIAGDNVWLLRVGADFFPDEQELIDRLGVGERIVHAGRIYDDARLAVYYRAAEVFAFPSLWEGFGWPLLEAMACGTPVVASNVASLPEVVGSAGITVPPRDHVRLARELAALLSSEALRRQRAAASLERARAFSWTECAKHTLDVYREVAAEAGPAGPDA